MLPTWISITALMVLGNLMIPGQAADLETLRHIGYFHDLNYDQNLHVSMAGGAILQFWGSGFNESPISNAVCFRTSSLTTNEITLCGMPMNDQDEFRSEPSHAGRISYTMPDMNALMAQYGLGHDWFDSYDYIVMAADVLTGQDTLRCGEGKYCQIIPSWLMTPIWYGMSPPVLYPGQKATLLVNPGGAPWRQLSGTFLRMIDVKLDDVELDRNPFTDEEVVKQAGLGARRMQYVEGNVKTQVRTLNSIMTAWFHGAGYAYKQELASKNCNVDMTDCYDVRIMPSITGISSSGGYTSGGQELTITGTSLNGTAIDIKVDGSECEVTDSGFFEITCLTGEKVPGTSQPVYPGQHGLRRKNWDNNNVSNTTFQNYPNDITFEVLMTSYEIAPTRELHRSFDRITGFFEAPVDGKYQFHASCDDLCEFYMSLTDPLDPGAMELLIERRNNDDKTYDFRDFSSHSYSNDPDAENTKVGQVFSQWLTLTKGQMYYTETHYLQWNYNAHMTIGVEIQPDNVADVASDHPQQTPQYQLLKVNTDLSRDTATLLINSPESEEFKIIFRHPEDISLEFESAPIQAGCSADEMKEAIKVFYLNSTNTEPQVTLKCYGTDTLERECTTDTFYQCADPAGDGSTYIVCDSCKDTDGGPVGCDSTLATTCVDSNAVETECAPISPATYIPDYQYTIEVPRSIGPAYSWTFAEIVPSSSKFDLKSPVDLAMQSNEPLRGTYMIECFEPGSSTPRRTDPIDVYASLDDIKAAIIKNTACPKLRNKFEIIKTNDPYVYEEDGLNLLLFLEHVNGNLEQFKIIDNENDILQEGQEPLTGVSVDIESSEVQPRGPNIYYKVVPFELLYTDETTPQVMVTIDDQVALCASLACGYTYEAPIAEVTGMTVTDQEVAITGTDFSSDIDSVTVGYTGCTVTSNDATSIACTLDYPLIAGTWLPEVKDVKGLFPVDDTLLGHTVALVVTSVTPNSNLNPAGGDTIVIVGSGFPSVTTIGDAVLSVTFDDGAMCDLTSSTPTEMQCLTRGFDSTNLSTTLRFLIVATSSGQEQVEVVLNSDPLVVDSITPNSASPILTATLVVQLGAAYDSTGMGADTFNVTLVPSDGGKKRALNVIDIDPTDKRLTVKYGGAYSGVYSLEVTSAANGALTTDGVTFEAKIQVTDFNPRRGSKMGGTLITIDGGHFSDKITDNPVKYDKEFVQGIDHYCYVKSSQDDQIVCRMSTDYTRLAGNAEMIVFASTFEEATYADGVNKMFTFLDTDSIPTISTFTVDFTSDLYYKITITGSSITDTDTSTVDVIFGGSHVQEILSVSDTQIEVKLIGLDSGSISNSFEVYLVEGIPNGWHDPTQQSPTAFDAGITFDPKIIHLSTHEVTSAGAVIYAEVIGAGVNDPISLRDSSSFEICEEVTMVSYSLLECKTKVKEYSSAESFSVFNTETQQSYPCANTADNTQCQYTTLATASAPSYTSVTLDTATQTTLTFTGTNLNEYGTGTICDVEVLGIMADSCSVDSSTTITASFSTGFPVTETEALPTLRISSDCDASLGTLCSDAGVKNKFVVAAPVDFTGIANALAISNDAAQITQCSFAGGCIRTIEAKGLTTSVLNNRAEIKVCGKACTIDETLSNASETKCEVPYIQSIESMKSFTMEKPGEILGDLNIYSTTDLADLAYDGNNLPGAKNTGENCYIGTRFEGDASGYFVGILDEVKLFMDYFSDKSVYTDNLIFQGSNVGFDDPAQITEILKIDEELHEGWNYYKFTEIFGESYVLPRFRYYRFFNARNNGCDKIGEVSFIGSKAFESEQANHFCSVTVAGDDFAEQSLTDLGGAQVEYVVATTPYLTSISPRWGSVVGSTTVTFVGENFSVESSDYTILIDGIECIVGDEDATTTSVSCLTGPRTGLYQLDPELSIFIDGIGYVATQGHVYRYVSLWSSPTTWGGLSFPIDGESIRVDKGLNLLVDIKNSPKLNLIIVEGGSLIFPSYDDDLDYHQTFDAHYIFLNSGALMEIGTEEQPYRSKLTITMHGQRFDPYIPKFGNKCIGVRYSTLDIHGEPRTPTWTSLESTAFANDSTITLMEDVDWKEGEEIVIASTDLGVDDNEVAGEGDNSEVRTITEVNGRTITLDSPLLYEHYAAVDTYGVDDTIELRAEVGLLTRNIKFQGDPETSLANQYGATIMLHSPGDESVIGRVEHMEFFNVGQAFQLGRYPIHYHMIGQVTESYVRGNSFHNSFNRGTTIHGVHYLRVERNVYHHCKGHNIFIEDGVETRNYVYKNLVVAVRASHSTLNTDTTPAAFWVTNPDNIWIGNHAAGGPRYGFWFDLQDNSIGPSASSDICPIGFKLGEFKDNVAHSVGRYGLRIFHKHLPRTHPCRPVVFDEEAFKAGTNPYHSNPVIPAYYRDFIGYKCGRNGVIAEDLGAVRFINFKTIDNTLAGIEVNSLHDIRDDPWGAAYVDGALVIGRSHKSKANPTTFQGVAQESDFTAENISPHGVISPQSDYWTIKNVKFYNFDFNEAAALGSCSHCHKPPATNSDGWTVKLQDLTIDDTTVTKKIRYQLPYKTIYFDANNTLTGLGPGSWAISDRWSHNLWPDECFEDAVFDGFICVNTVTIRSLYIHNYAPSNLQQKGICILKYDQSIIGDYDSEELTTYESAGADLTASTLRGANSYCSIIDWRFIEVEPWNHWTAPFVTGHTYYLRWEFGMDFDAMRFAINEPLWDSIYDKDIKLEIPVYSARDGIEVKDSNNTIIANETYHKDDVHNVFGANLVLNETFESDILIPDKERRLKLAISAASPGNTVATDTIKFLDLTAIKPSRTSLVVEKELGDAMNWSDENAWRFEPKRIPMEGDRVVIESDMNIILDIPAEDMPKFKSVEINGKLMFAYGEDRALKSYSIWVRGGELWIGSPLLPFDAKATITLLGDNTDEHWSFSSAVEAGNKNLVVTGDVHMHGTARKVTSCRLLDTVYSGANSLKVDRNLDWAQGEMIGIAATNMRTMDYDECTIEEYDPDTGIVQCVDPLDGYHFGAGSSTIDDFEVDMRAEVFLLDRNIKIQASTDDIGKTIREPWGCRILVSDFTEPTGVKRKGSLTLESVQVYNCSQKMTYKAAIAWEGAFGGESSIKDSVISSGRAIGIMIKNSANVKFVNNTIANFIQHGIWVKQSQSITLTGNWLHHVPPEVDKDPRMDAYPIMAEYEIGGISVSDGTSKITVTNNVVSGTYFAGYHFKPDKCDKDSHQLISNADYIFENNIAHSISGYGAVAKKTEQDCTLVRDFTAYKCSQASIMLGGASKINVGRNIVSTDAHYGIAIHSAGDGDAHLYGSRVYGENEDNEDCPRGSPCDHCVDTIGVLVDMACDDTHKDYNPKFFKLPLFKLCTSSMYGGATYHDVEFINWKSAKKACGSRQFALGPWNRASDYVPYVEFKSPVFENVVEDAMAYIYTPHSSWINWEDCGIEFTCTGLYNAVIRIENAIYRGSTSTSLPRTFDITSNNLDSISVQAFKDSICSLKPAWNAWICADGFAVLIFDSLDEDRLERSAQPVYIKALKDGEPLCNDDGECFENKLNAFMDNCWDDFYGCQERPQRFPTMVYQGADEYQITYTSIPPENQKFVLHSFNTEGFRVKMFYSESDTSYALYTDDNPDVPISPTEWDDDLQGFAPLQERCGQNRYVSLENYLEFYITPNCPLTIRPRQAITLGVRLEFSLDDFFSNGGVTTFVDQMAASLGIHAADIKVVSVYEGSTIVDFQIISSVADAAPLDLDSVKETFETVVSTMDTFMGSPVLNAISTGTPIVTPNTVLDESGQIKGGDVFNFGGFGADEGQKEEKEPEVIVEFRYQDKTQATKYDTSNSDVTGYVAIILIVIVIIILVVVAVALYKQIISKENQVAKNEVPETIKTQPEFEDLDGLEQQYSPNKLYIKSPSFGGIDFDRSPTIKKKVKAAALIFEKSQETDRDEDSQVKLNIVPNAMTEEDRTSISSLLDFASKRKRLAKAISAEESQI